MIDHISEANAIQLMHLSSLDSAIAICHATYNFDALHQKKKSGKLKDCVFKVHLFAIFCQNLIPLLS